MKIGILADIHGHVSNLQLALLRLRVEVVDRIVLLGDVIERTRNACETVAMLRSQGAVGVWGNHELGLCLSPDEELRSAYTEPVIEFFDKLRSRFEIDDLLFSHSLPSQDPTDPTAYYLASRPDEEGALDASFAEYPHRIMFVGHFHRWFAATTNHHLDWNGQGPLHLSTDQRYLIVVNAVMNGYLAIFDQSEQTLTPIELDTD